MPATLREEVNGPLGYSTRLVATSEDLATIRTLIERQWLDNLRRCAPRQAAAFAELGCARYHELADAVDHSTIWPKRARLLPPDAVHEVLATSFFVELRQALGDFTISDEDDIGWEEIYWRLVRPRAASDVGPLHADQWFWELGNAVTPLGTQRIKCWMAVETEPELNGLQVVPGSHLQDWKFHGEMRFGMLKPQIDEDESQFDLKLLPLAPGGAVTFHDKLLHRGAFNTGKRTRVSLEFTMFVKA